MFMRMQANVIVWRGTTNTDIDLISPHGYKMMDKTAHAALPYFGTNKCAALFGRTNTPVLRTEDICSFLKLNLSFIIMKNRGV